MELDTETKARSGALFAGGGIITGLASLIGASCCVLPVLLVQAGVSTALVAHLGVFARAKPYLLAVTAALVLAGFVAAFWGGRRPRPRVLILLVVAALLVAGAYAMPFYERELLDWVRGR
jgi:mercuric ion transport protein